MYTVLRFFIRPQRRAHNAIGCALDRTNQILSVLAFCFGHVINGLGNFNLNLDGTATVDGEIVSGTIKLGLGYGTSSERETTVEVTCNVNDASDFLGSAKIEYIDPIIKSSSEQNGVQGYIVNGITTGTVDMMVLPMSF